MHISEFPRDQRRPQVTDLLVYEIGVDERGRTRATSVRFLSAARAVSPRHDSSQRGDSAASSLVASATFVLLVLLLAAFGRVSWLIPPPGYVVMSMLAYVAYAQDKRAAQNGTWRTGEGTLIGLGLFGGWPGALIARQALRHKTRKQPFVSFFWASIVVHVALLVWLAVALPFAGLS